MPPCPPPLPRACPHGTGKFTQDGESHLLPSCQRDQETRAGGGTAGVTSTLCPPALTRGLLRALVPCPHPVPLPLAAGDLGIPPAKPDGEGAALLQLRRLRHPLCGPGEWRWTRVDVVARWEGDEGSASQPDPCPAPDTVLLAAGHVDTRRGDTEKAAGETEVSLRQADGQAHALRGLMGRAPLLPFGLGQRPQLGSCCQGAGFFTLGLGDAAGGQNFAPCWLLG